MWQPEEMRSLGSELAPFGWMMLHAWGTSRQSMRAHTDLGDRIIAAMTRMSVYYAVVSDGCVIFTFTFTKYSLEHTSYADRSSALLFKKQN